MQSQHRYGEVNTLLARAEHEIKDIREGTMHAEFNALRAPVAINDGNPDEAERLAKLALEELPPGWFHSRIGATSVLGEVLHCKGELTRSLALMQQTEQMARQHVDPLTGANAANRTDGTPARRLALRLMEFNPAK